MGLTRKFLSLHRPPGEMTMECLAIPFLNYYGKWYLIFPESDTINTINTLLIYSLVRHQ